MKILFSFKTTDASELNSNIIEYSYIKKANNHHKEISDYLTLLTLINVNLKHIVIHEKEFPEERLISINSNIKKTNDFTEKLLKNSNLEMDEEIKEWLKYEKRYLEKTKFKAISTSYEAMVRSKNLMRSISEFMHLNSNVKFDISSQSKSYLDIQNKLIVINNIYTYDFEKINTRNLHNNHKFIIKSKNYEIDMTYIRESLLDGSTDK